jgi:hypothetical protein
MKSGHFKLPGTLCVELICLLKAQAITAAVIRPLSWYRFPGICYLGYHTYVIYAKFPNLGVIEWTR